MSEQSNEAALISYTKKQELSVVSDESPYQWYKFSCIFKISLLKFEKVDRLKYLVITTDVSDRE